MEVRLETLSKSEQIAYSLRSLYESYGYRMFRMSKFEEYEIYSKNREFLTGGGQIITFSDLSGKLLALKPDITLSIVKNTRATPDSPEKACYAESVYRVSRDVREFRQINQVGLEYIGKVTPYVSVELVTLALKSLRLIGGRCILGVSHMGFLTGLLESIGARSEAQTLILNSIEAKSPHGLEAAIDALGLCEADAERLRRFAALSGGLGEALERAKGLVVNPAMQKAYEELSVLASVLGPTPEGAALRLDFSMTSDLKYYNGLMLRGYVEDVARAVLSGGRYDPLLSRMGKGALEAIGFGVGLDEIERLYHSPRAAEPDVVVLYDEQSDLAAVHGAVEGLLAQGQRVTALESAAARGAGAARVLRVCGKQLVEEARHA